MIWELAWKSSPLCVHSFFLKWQGLAILQRYISLYELYLSYPHGSYIYKSELQQYYDWPKFEKGESTRLSSAYSSKFIGCLWRCKILIVFNCVGFKISALGIDREWRLLLQGQQDCQYILLLPRRAISVTFSQKGRPSPLSSMFLVLAWGFSWHQQFVQQCMGR